MTCLNVTIYFIISILILDTVNNVSLSVFNNTRILKGTTETIDGDFHFKSNLLVNGNMVVNGLTNELDLSEYNVNTPSMSDSIGAARDSLTATIQNQCSSLSFVTDALASKCY